MNDIGISAIISLLAAASAVAGFMWLWPDTLPASPMAGERGRRRKEALDMGGFFHFVEPLIRVLALHVASLPLNGMRSRIEKRLTQAGRPLGLDANDLISASILTAATIGLVGGIASAQLGRGAGAGIITGLVFGAITPWFKVDDVSRKRCIAVCRGLPQAIDLVALSMEAGLDFPGALSQVTGQLPANNPLRFEFEHILQKLSLGWSRRTALDELSVRIQAPQVRQFTSSVNQAEKRGTPLARVLSTQAEVMRTKRSQAAEQAAARAAVLILGPLMLIFACVFIIILGPFVIKFMRGEIF